MNIRELIQGSTAIPVLTVTDLAVAGVRRCFPAGRGKRLLKRGPRVDAGVGSDPHVIASDDVHRAAPAGSHSSEGEASGAPDGDADAFRGTERQARGKRAHVAPGERPVARHDPAAQPAHSRRAGSDSNGA